MSIEARKWAWALEQLGLAVRWIAGDGDGLDIRVLGLGIDAPTPPAAREVLAAIEGCDVVIVENLLSLPLNPGALEVVGKVLAGRPAVVHHHDLPWQRERFAAAPPPPDDAAWVHVTINDLSRDELRARGIAATRIYNRFSPPPRLGTAVPEMVGPVVLHPTRAIPRKNVGAAVALAEALDATYWLLGPAEDGYGPALRGILERARCPVVHGGSGVAIGDAYAACDLVAYPSTWEGFGNPTIESALARRPIAVGNYPVLEELRGHGFRWFHHERDLDAIRAFVAAPNGELLDHNEALAREHFGLDGLPAELAAVLERLL